MNRKSTKPTAEQLHYHIAIGLFLAVQATFSRRVQVDMTREFKKRGIDINNKIAIRKYLKSKRHSRLEKEFFDDRDPGSAFCEAFDTWWDVNLFVRQMLDEDGFSHVLNLFEDMVEHRATYKFSKHYHAIQAALRGEFPTPPASLSLAA